MSIARLFTQTASVETRLGSGTTGERFASAVSRPCFVDDAVRLVRNSQGEEVVSSSRLYGPPEDAAVYLPGSKVTVNDRTARVISTARRDNAGPTSAHHVEVQLT